MQLSLFDGINEFKIKKPIRLIELFAGYGSQHLALKYLGVNCESWKICEWAIKSIQAYKDLHFENDNIDYSADCEIEYIVDELTKLGISANYNEPMSKEQIKRLGEKQCRKVYNNIKATHNLVNIQQVHAQDLEIADKDKYDYVLTYSFPCQDLSKAGKGKGMEKGSNTRSGMLWEVERILKECNKDLPQILLMENVPQVHGNKNIEDFNKWREFLESLGYKNYWKDLNAKCFNIPQNRNRCFMVSILGDYYYEFPQPIKLEKRLKDLLEEEVDEKYYLSDKFVNYICADNNKWTGNNGNSSCINKDIASTITTREDNVRADCSNYVSKYLPQNCSTKTINIKEKELPITIGNENYIQEENLKTKLCNELIASGRVKENDVIRHSYSTSRMNGDKKDIQSNNMCPTLDTRCDCLGVVQDLRIRKLTPKECFRLMGVKDEDYEKIAKNQSNASLYHLAGDSIVVNVLMAIFRSIL